MPRIVYYVVGDAGLNSGNGRFLRSLEDLRNALQPQRNAGTWTLVISIHGAEQFIANRSAAVRGGAGSYDAAAIRRIFGQNAAFVRWRDQFGPARVVLNACQVGVGLERAIIESLTRRGSGQAVQGLGSGCRPSTEVLPYEYQNRPVSTRQQYSRLPPEVRDDMLNSLRVLNRRWGYFGAPPVQDADILSYYFDEPPLGAWVIVRVSKDRIDTDIPFYNRATHADFLRVCTAGVGTLRDHVPQAPPAPREGR